MRIGQNGGHTPRARGGPVQQIEPIEHILAGCQIAVVEERHPITGQGYRALRALHPSGHVYEIRFGLAQAKLVGDALRQPSLSDTERAGVDPVRTNLKKGEKRIELPRSDESSRKVIGGDPDKYDAKGV